MSKPVAFRIRENFNSKAPFYHKRKKMEPWQKLCLQEYFAVEPNSIKKKFPGNSNDEHFCLKINNSVQPGEINFEIETSYFVGANWVLDNKFPILVEPKFNIESQEIELDYIKILFEALKNTSQTDYLSQLVFIDYNALPIVIDQKSDILTPLLVIQYLHVLKRIVKKGLRRSYYKISSNLTTKVKGKVLIAQTQKKNFGKGNLLKIFCSYEEFGVDYLENKLLKKALNIGLQHMSLLNLVQSGLGELEDVINYVKVGFQGVNDDLEKDSITAINSNPFYKDYEEALVLADKILKRFGYNVSRSDSDEVMTPPFWIDMSKLFELFILEKLNLAFKGKNEVMYQEKVYGLYPDFLISTLDGKHKILIDAKYKGYSQKSPSIDDIRQISGYARLEGVYEKLGLHNKESKLDKVIECLIIYPDLLSGVKCFDEDTFVNAKKVNGYYKISSLGIHIPFIKK